MTPVKTRLLAPLLCLLLAGCGTVSKKVSFDPDKGETFLLMAADEITDVLPGSYTYVFRRVDVANSKFLPETMAIVFDSGVGTFVVHEFAKPAGLTTTLRFGGRRLVPGDYALISRTDTRQIGMSQNSDVRC